MEGELRSLEQRIWAEAGEEFNVNSPVKLGQILFEKLKYPVLKKTAKTRSSSTGFEVLTELAEQGLSLPKLVLEFREISKLKGTYVDALPLLADEDGRIHSSFRQNVAATGRLSSSDPNLQNIPIRTATGREIRKAFIAPPGFRLVVADYSQIELRILAHLSGDAALIQAFEEGQDIHRATAARIFGVAPDLVTSRDALRLEEDQLRAPLRNGGVHAGQGARRLDVGGEDLRGLLLQPVPERARLPRRDPRRGAPHEGSHDALRAGASDPGHRGLQRRGARPTPSAWP